MIRHSKYLAAAWLFSAITISCSAEKGDGTQPVAAAVNNTPCGPVQELKRRSAAWVFYQCGQTGNLYITPETLDSFTGQPLGDRSVGRGKLSFRFTDLHNDKISYKENFGAFFQAFGSENGTEVNWQWMSYSVGSGKIVSRLIIQRFHDNTCWPREFCEQSYITDELQFLNTDDVWQWDCQWNMDDGYIICDITKPSDQSFAPIRAWNQMLGTYYGLSYIGIGQNAYQGPYPGYNGTVSDVKLTIFE